MYLNRISGEHMAPAKKMNLLLQPKTSMFESLPNNVLKKGNDQQEENVELRND